jgi:hypothetical protein
MRDLWLPDGEVVLARFPWYGRAGEATTAVLTTRRLVWYDPENEWAGENPWLTHYYFGECVGANGPEWAVAPCGYEVYVTFHLPEPRAVRVTPGDVEEIRPFALL